MSEARLVAAVLIAAPIRRYLEGPLPVALAELGDRVAELDQLRLAEVGVQARPQVVACLVSVPFDRATPSPAPLAALVRAPRRPRRRRRGSRAA